MKAWGPFHRGRAIRAGLALIFAGIFFARPPWRARTDLSRLLRLRYGRLVSLFNHRADLFRLDCSPTCGHFGDSQCFLGTPIWFGILATAAFAMIYTSLGGMWSVAKTDTLQVFFVVLGLVFLMFAIAQQYGDVDKMWHQLSPKKRHWLGGEEASALLKWTKLLAIGSLGNVCGSDLMQRVFAARSEKIAQKSCIIAGVLYMSIGALPVMVGLYGAAYLPSPELGSIIANFIASMLQSETASWWFYPAFSCMILALFSAVLSTLDSGMLTAASVLGQNVFGPLSLGGNTKALVKRCLYLTTVISLIFAFLGEDAFSLLEGSYALSMAGPLVPLSIGLYTKFGGQWAASTSLFLGFGSVLYEATSEAVGLPFTASLPVPLAGLDSVFLAILSLGVEERRVSEQATRGQTASLSKVFRCSKFLFMVHSKGQSAEHLWRVRICKGHDDGAQYALYIFETYPALVPGHDSNARRNLSDRQIRTTILDEYEDAPNTYVRTRIELFDGS